MTRMRRSVSWWFHKGNQVHVMNIIEFFSVDWSFQTAFFLEIESSQHQKVAECSVHYLRKWDLKLWKIEKEKFKFKSIWFAPVCKSPACKRYRQIHVEKPSFERQQSQTESLFANAMAIYTNRVPKMQCQHLQSDALNDSHNDIICKA